MCVAYCSSCSCTGETHCGNHIMLYTKISLLDLASTPTILKRRKGAEISQTIDQFEALIADEMWRCSVSLCKAPLLDAFAPKPLLPGRRTPPHWMYWSYGISNWSIYIYINRQEVDCTIVLLNGSFLYRNSTRCSSTSFNNLKWQGYILLVHVFEASWMLPSRPAAAERPSALQWKKSWIGWMRWGQQLIGQIAWGWWGHAARDTARLA